MPLQTEELHHYSVHTQFLHAKNVDAKIALAETEYNQSQSFSYL